MSRIIVADQDMPGLEDFQRLGEVRRVNGRRLSRADLQDAEMLLVRSVTRVDGDLLAGTGVRFVGSATIGTDHVDQVWLQQQGIRFQHAPGCNAVAVAEYVLQAMVRWCLERNVAPDSVSLGLVGCGNVGGRVARFAGALGLRVLSCDPPRHRQGLALAGETVALERALEADVVSLHVPLIEAGEDATRHLLDASRLASLTQKQLLINTCRGAVVDNAALERRLAGGGPATVLDVWEGEPRIRPGLFHRLMLGTPHIAGHSREGKLRGTRMLYQAGCHWLGETPSVAQVMPPAGNFAGDVRELADVLALLISRYDQNADHRRLAASLAEADPGASFDDLRRHYPARHECAGLRVEGTVEKAWRPLLNGLGVDF